MAESDLQIAFINWMRIALPEVTVWHVMNEHNVRSDKGGAIQGKIRKDRGVLAGVHDNHLIWKGRNYATIELKDPDKTPGANKYSDSQKGFAEALDRAGFLHACCQNGNQIEAAVRSFGLSPRYPFPLALSGTKKQILQTAYLMESYRND